tara:strand:+ start:281 stop:472 length:192 start_codon:yes stop_codon:yes gene_type:complete
MKVKTLIKKLKKFNPDTPMRFYFLKDWNLEGCKIETILDVGEQVELTIQNEDTMEGGVSKWVK